MANEAGVRELVYTHIAPPIPARPMRVPWLRGVREVRRDGVRLGHDGMLITIPLDGGPIGITDIDPAIAPISASGG
jgi:ribonuclease Z